MAMVIAVVLGLLVLAAFLVRRGVESALEAQRVMDATGDPELTGRRHRVLTILSSLILVATVLVAFLAGAAILASRDILLR